MLKVNPAPFLFLVLSTALSNPARAQQLASTALPDSPGASMARDAAPASSSTSDVEASFMPVGEWQVSSAAPPGPGQPMPQQTRRILGIIPNFRAVSADAKLPPETVKEKFIDATEDSFDYSSIVLPTFLAAESYLSNATPEFGRGGAAFGRYEWHSVLDQTSENYFVEFIVPTLAHEDTRYYTMGKGGFKKRAIYAIERIVVTRNDHGNPTFNSGEILGAAFSASLSNAYYPQADRTVSKTMTQFGTNVGVDAFTFFFKEFWPEINRDILHGHGGGD